MSVDLKWACAAGALVVTVWSVEHGLPMAATPSCSAVVRSLTSVGTLSPRDRAWSTSASVVLEPEWQPANVRVVGFLQERERRRIVGAGSSRLDPAVARLQVE